MTVTGDEVALQLTRRYAGRLSPTFVTTVLARCRDELGEAASSAQVLAAAQARLDRWLTELSYPW